MKNFRTITVPVDKVPVGYLAYTGHVWWHVVKVEDYNCGPMPIWVTFSDGRSRCYRRTHKLLVEVPA